MKKLFLVSCCLLFGLICKAQNDTCRLMFGGVGAVYFGTPVFNGPQKAPLLGYNVSANMCFLTPTTYHNLLFTGTNAIKMINGRYKSNFGEYLMLQKSLGNNDFLAGLGVEFFFPYKNGVTSFLYAEFNKNLTTANVYNFQFGIHTNYQKTFWKHKT